jgi:hypothetical protein
MSKVVKLAIEEVTRVEITDEMWSHSKTHWASREVLQARTDRLVAAVPSVKADFYSDRTVNVEKDGQKGRATYRTYYTGTPQLWYQISHVDDIAWVYPKIKTRKIAGPVWA